MNAIAVVPSGQIQPPNTSLPPDYSVEDCTRNWFFFSPPGGGPREVTTATPRDIVRFAQKSLNDNFGLSVREDGLLDTRTLDEVAKRLPQKWLGALPGGGDFRSQLAGAASSLSMNAPAWTALILMSTPSLWTAPGADMAWILRGGVALGTNEQVRQVRYPRVIKSSFFDESLPGFTATVRRHKTPILIGGGLLAVAAVGAAYYFRNQD